MIPVFEPVIGEEEVAAVVAAIRRGEISGSFGESIPRFEEAFAAYCGCKYGIAVSSGTAALHLAVAALDLKAGDEILVSASTNIATALAAYHNNLVPVPVDSEPHTWNLNLDLIEDLITPRTRAIIPVHLFGHPVDMDHLCQIARKHNLAVIEDCAESHGATCHDRMTGSFGDMGCFSFYANKNLSTGEGGAIALNDSASAETLQSLRQHALPLDAWKRFSHPETMLLSNQLTELGYKMNYIDLQACIGRVQLRRQVEFAGVRQKIAKRYVDRLGKLAPKIRFQQNCADAKHALHLFIVLLPLERMKISREHLILGLRARNIGATIHYQPLHTMPLYVGSAESEHLPVTEDVARRCVTLPISASMTMQDADDVIDSFSALHR